MMNNSELVEITYLNKKIDELVKENERLAKQISFNNDLITKAKADILILENRKNIEIFDYLPLINGKINGIAIKSISIHGCQCLENKKCDNMHAIHIYGTNSKERINFNNEKRFTLEELIELNYVDKLEITVDDDWSYQLKNNCELAKCYPTKVVVYTYGYC